MNLEYFKESNDEALEAFLELVKPSSSEVLAYEILGRGMVATSVNNFLLFSTFPNTLVQIKKNTHTVESIYSEMQAIA